MTQKGIVLGGDQVLTPDLPAPCPAKAITLERHSRRSTRCLCATIGNGGLEEATARAGSSATGTPDAGDLSRRYIC